MAEKSLSIALKGRDESAAAFASVEKRISGISGASIAKMAGTFFAIGGLAKAAAAGVMGVMAANKAAIADQEQSATGLLEAQIKANAAWAELAGALPMIGESAKKIMETLGDNEGIRAQIAVIKDLEKEYGRLTETLKKWRQENEQGRLKPLASLTMRLRQSALVMRLRNGRLQSSRRAYLKRRPRTLF